MKKKTVLIYIILSLSASVLYSCRQKQAVPESIVDDADTVISDCDQYVRFQTTMGDFVIKLYQGTPLHRHNMVRNVRRGVYDGQLFFGVDRKFKIQTGDPKSRGAAPGVTLGIEDNSDTIKGEIFPARYYHKRGAVGQASVRQVNFSTSQQFYIITGTKASASTLADCEEKIEKKWFKALKDSLTQPYAQEILEYRRNHNNNKISVLNDKLNKETEAVMKTRKPFRYSKEQIQEYATNGGAPTLDGYYTVFGEVVEGMNVVDSISRSHIDKNGRPVPDVKIIKAVLVDWEDTPAQ